MKRNNTNKNTVHTLLEVRKPSVTKVLFLKWKVDPSRGLFIESVKGWAGYLNTRIKLAARKLPRLDKLTYTINNLSF